MSGSLDEKRFAEVSVEAGQMSRTSTMPDVSHAEQQKDLDSEDASTTTTTSDTSVQSVRKPASSASIDIPAKSADGGAGADKDDPLRRERIERYKEERRMKLREKYGLQSFKGDKEDDLVERLKQKIPKWTKMAFLKLIILKGAEGVPR